MITLELSTLQARDLLKLIDSKLRRVVEHGDAPYWRAIKTTLTDALEAYERTTNPARLTP